MTEGARGPANDRLGVERVAFFSDAVFAIAITLLVIEITVPEGDMTGAQLTHELGRLGPKFFSFGLSFWVIGRLWISHHVTFQYLRRWDMPMLWINLFWLACIVFLPFPTAVLGNHIALPGAARLYAATVTVTGLASTLLWWYATGRGSLGRRGPRPTAAALHAAAGARCPGGLWAVDPAGHGAGPDQRGTDQPRALVAVAGPDGPVARPPGFPGAMTLAR
jgi:uncharacterized membrane protein